MAADPLVDVAASIADGQTPDWTTATRDLSSEEERGVADELELVARIAAAHRQLHQLLPPVAAAEAEPFADRTRWGHLDLLEVVGRGSYGTVYRAWDTRLERLVALKLFHRAPNPDAVMLEGKMLARVRHENVVTVYGADIIDGVAGIWMEFVHGRTLDQIVKGQGAMPAREAATIGADVAKGLAAIHGAQLLHCDVKAQNVVRESTGRVVLMDMGAGRVIADASDDDQLSDITGTPRYMAPELFETGTPATRATDVYSLGVLLYYLASARFPVEGKSVNELRQAHAAGRVEPLDRARPGMPAPYLALVSPADAARRATPPPRVEMADVGGGDRSRRPGAGVVAPRSVGARCSGPIDRGAADQEPHRRSVEGLFRRRPHRRADLESGASASAAGAVVRSRRAVSRQDRPGGNREDTRRGTPPGGFDHAGGFKVPHGRAVDRPDDRHGEVG
jgi:serine/threonine-protein kinase